MLRPTQAVSVLKPLRGADPEMYECFRSHCLQDYRNTKSSSGVSDANDPGNTNWSNNLKDRVSTATRSASDDYAPEKLGNNSKVSNLAQMVRQSKLRILSCE